MAQNLQLKLGLLHITYYYILLHITEYSHTLTLRSDEVIKLCVEAAVSAAQGWTAVEINWKKYFVTYY